jgi:hypothetical protein
MRLRRSSLSVSLLFFGGYAAKKQQRDNLYGDVVPMPLAGSKASLKGIGAAPPMGINCGGLCFHKAKNARKSVPAHSDGGSQFFDFVEKLRTPTSIGL